MRFRYVALISLVFTYVFFLEYLSPLRRYHIPYDLAEFHYPLADYAFQALKQGRVPQWDASIYCGVSFVGNIQAALFYPPTWLMFAANWSRQRLSYQSLEVLVIAHVWLAFLLCYWWLRTRKLHALACALGAGVFAFSGFVCLQLQHLGLIAGHAWFPLGFMGIDQAYETRSWRPFWKLILASAFCFLAGYPPVWVVFSVCMAVYALARPWRTGVILGTAISLGISLLLCMVQVLPAWEASALMVKDAKYGLGIKDPRFFLSYVVPNFFNFGIHVPIHENPGMEYLYLGAPALLGMTLLLRRRNVRTLAPFLAVGAVSLILLTNPHNLAWNVIQHSSLLSQVCRSWYFLAGLAAVAAPLAAYGLDDCFNRPVRPLSRWLLWLALVLTAAWSGWELWRYLNGDSSLASGWRAALDSAMTLAILALSLYVWRAQRGATQILVAIVLLLGVGVDYKVFGTRKRFNAGEGSGQAYFSESSFPGFDPAAFRELQAHRQYRILLDPSGPSPLELRHAGLATPQGFDPFFTAQYRALLHNAAQFRSDWLFDIDPENQPAMRLLGVRYVVAYRLGANYSQLAGSPNLRLVGTGDAPYQVFEYASALPPYGFADASSVRSVDVTLWTPERREFEVNSGRGGRFALQEQFFPGWRAAIDGQSVEIDHWHEAFQSLNVPPGRHTVQFRYRSKGLVVGAWISLGSLVMLTGIFLRRGVLGLETFAAAQSRVRRSD